MHCGSFGSRAWAGSLQVIAAITEGDQQMRTREMIVKHVALGCLGALGLLFGCSPNTADTTDSTEAAIKAASPACTSARDACKAQIQTAVAGIETACKPVGVACGEH